MAQQAPNPPLPCSGTNAGLQIRIDTHVHSIASNQAKAKIAGIIDRPECYSEPEQVYEQARDRGMNLVTLTDHDTIDGGLALINRGFEDFVLGEEVTVYFPQDLCKLHVLVWGLTPEQHEQIHTLNLRNNVYDFAQWLKQERLAHSLAHPLYNQSKRLKTWHLKQAALLFNAFEAINCAHSSKHLTALAGFLSTLSAQTYEHLASQQNLAPLWDTSTPLAQTAGSDDHALLNIARAHTLIQGVAPSSGAFLDAIMSRDCSPQGSAGDTTLLAHQFIAVAANHLYATRSPPGRLSSQIVRSKLMRFAGVSIEPPSKSRITLHAVRKKLRLTKGSSLPVVTALKHTITPILDQYPQLKDRLSPENFRHGVALSDHEQMSNFTDDLTDALTKALTPGTLRALKKRDRHQLLDHILSYALLQVAQIPYIISLFQQHQEKALLTQLSSEASTLAGLSSTTPPPLSESSERPLRVMLLSDTISDVNGVARFIQNMADQAKHTNRELAVLTCSTDTPPNIPNLTCFKPIFTASIPRYEELKIALPPVVRMLKFIENWKPDIIHVSTPGPMGILGLLAARALRTPLVGIYHTDFPSYVERLFEDDGLATVARTTMRWFYNTLDLVITRSDAYIHALDRIGVPPVRVRAVQPCVDTVEFHPEHNDESIWQALAPKPTLRVLYVGRISLEKNMPLLADIWARIDARCKSNDIDAKLILVGDGPYRSKMQKKLKHTNTHFAGYQHGSKLTAYYAGADIFVFPSITDTLGQVVLEAQASAVPAFVSDIGGPQEVVTHNTTGMILPHDNPDIWVNAIADLLQDPSRLADMKVAARALADSFALPAGFESFWDLHLQAWNRYTQKASPTSTPCPEPCSSTNPV